MKFTLTFRVLLIVFCLFCRESVYGQKFFKGVTKKYTFKVDTSYWKMAGPVKVARKIQFDKHTKGIEPKYEYIFCTNNHVTVDVPFFTMVIIPSESNLYEGFKLNLGKKDRIKITETDDKRKAISYTVEDAKGIYFNVLYFRDNYMLMYVFDSDQENLSKAYKKFSEVVLSTKFE